MTGWDERDDGWLDHLAGDDEPAWKVPPAQPGGETGDAPATWRDELARRVRDIDRRLELGGHVSEVERDALGAWRRDLDVLRAADLLGIRRPKVTGPSWAHEKEV